MSEGVRRFWPVGMPSLAGGRNARRGFYYYAFKGEAIAGLKPELADESIEASTRAEAAILRLNELPPNHPTLEALAYQLIRAEAVASSRIEGIDMRQRRLAESAFDPKLGSISATQVLGNVVAIQTAMRLGARARRMTVEALLEIHRELFRDTSDERIGGHVRTTQNWIGGRGDNPHKAQFVPVPEEDVPGLLADLCHFIDRRDLSPIVQAAIAHAQFETIHPFDDGNGRVGRALVHLILRRRDIAPHHLAPFSLVLASNLDDYITGLTEFRRGNVDRWCGSFAQAMAAAADCARALASDIDSLKAGWRELATPRAGSAAANLIELLPAHPVFDLKTATELLGVSDEATRLGIDRLEKAGVVKEITKRKWGRAWECVGLFALLDGFERQLANPAGVGHQRAAPRSTGRGVRSSR